nr:MAG TPA: U1 small nuclear ribonucleoprotein [Bacteriophage sp.]
MIISRDTNIVSLFCVYCNLYIILDVFFIF